MHWRQLSCHCHVPVSPARYNSSVLAEYGQGRVPQPIARNMTRTPVVPSATIDLVELLAAAHTLHEAGREALREPGRAVHVGREGVGADEDPHAEDKARPKKYLYEVEDADVQRVALHYPRIVIHFAHQYS